MQGVLFEPNAPWTPPERYPRLGDEKFLIIDVETRDPNLKSKGPGWKRDDGEIVGFGVGTDRQEWYFPTKHLSGGNLDHDITCRWLRPLLSNPSISKIFFNAPYDIGWLEHDVGPVAGRVVCTQANTALLNENLLRYSLDSCARYFGIKGKDEALLREAAATFRLDPKVDLWKLHSKYVGEYGEGDIRTTRDLYNQQMPQIREQGLIDVWELEMDLIPLTIEMTRRGVRIDLDYADVLFKEWDLEEIELKKQILTRWGPPGMRDFSVWEAASLARIFDHNNLHYHRTPKTQKPSFKREWLEGHMSPLGKMVAKARRVSKAKDTFIKSMILNNIHNGRIHCDWYPLKTESDAETGQKGTVSGRFSAGNPSLQVMPSVEKTPELGKKIRKLFLPEEGCRWNSSDYSQQEPRWAVHYAYLLKLPGAKEAVQRYRTGDVDFHTMMAQDAGIERPKAKIINLGIIYGEGRAKLCVQLHLSDEEGKALIERYHERVPWLKALFNACVNRASSQGYIRTFLGRRGRFDRWEPVLSYEETYEDGIRKQIPTLNHAQALEAIKDPTNKLWYNREIKRSRTHKALNVLAQGSSADQMKLAMRELWKQGIVPKVQMHDELGNSTESEKQDLMIEEIMRDAVQVSLPFKVDVDIGNSWGEAA